MTGESIRNLEFVNVMKRRWFAGSLNEGIMEMPKRVCNGRITSDGSGRTTFDTIEEGRTG